MEGVSSGVPVVVRPPYPVFAIRSHSDYSPAFQYSTEKPRSDLGLLPLPEEEYQKGKVEELHAMSNFRVRILPVLGPLPAMVSLATSCIYV
jgi:hypothetical protein